MALEYARVFPDKVSHLVLIGSSATVGPEIHMEADRYFEESVCPERKVAFQETMQQFAEIGDQSFVMRLLAFGPRVWYDYNFNASKLWEGVAINSIGAGIIWSSMLANYDMTRALEAIQCTIFPCAWQV